MAYTNFIDAPAAAAINDPILSSGNLALLVAVVAFLICGFFLLTAVPAEPAGRQPDAAAPAMGQHPETQRPSGSDGTPHQRSAKT